MSFDAPQYDLISSDSIKLIPKKWRFYLMNDCSRTIQFNNYPTILLHSMISR